MLIVNDVYRQRTAHLTSFFLGWHVQIEPVGISFRKPSANERDGVSG